MAMSDRTAVTLQQKKRMPDSSDNEGTVVPASSKKAKVSAIGLTLQLLILELEPMDVTTTGKAYAVEKTVDTTDQILYEVDSDQCDFGLY
jgi:hypothetical protein